MKLLFLDIDGVLDSETFHHGPKDKLDFPFDRLDIRCLRLVEKIVTETGCQVVISSTWRETWGISDFNDLFKKFNCNIDVYALTPVHRESYKSRGLTNKDCKQAIMILRNPPHPNIGYDIYSGSRIYNSNIP